VPALSVYDYAIIRVVPRVERGEYLNAGVIVFCRTKRFLEARIALDQQRLRALDHSIDIEALEHGLATYPSVCAGGAAAGALGELPQTERFHWLIAPRSTVIQTSPVHCGLSSDPALELAQLLERYVL
jgi:hypothetical protein